jgi:hypothetical protein
MAFSIVKSRSKTWTQKSQSKSPPTLGISHQAFSKFAIPPIKLWSTSLSQMVEDYFGPTPVNQISTLITSTTPPLPSIDSHQINEIVRLIVGITTINIKKYYSEGGEKLNKTMIISFVLVFSSAIDTLPSTPDEDELIEGKI